MESETFDKEFERAGLFLKDKGFVIDERNLKALIMAKREGYPVFLVGPTGSGKTMLLSLMAEFWKGKYDYQSLNGSVTIHDLTQERILGKDGRFEEKDMVLAKWLRNAQRGVSICHFDEVNAARPETLLALHPIMDLKKVLVLPYTDEKLEVNKNAILVMSANEGDEYQGVNGLNAAFLNRSIKVHLPYIQGDVLAKRLANKTGISFEDGKSIVQVWSKYMDSRDPEQPVIGTRVLEMWATASKSMGLYDAGVICFAGLVAKNDDELASLVEGDMFVNLPKRRGK